MNKFLFLTIFSFLPEKKKRKKKRNQTILTSAVDNSKRCTSFHRKLHLIHINCQDLWASYFKIREKNVDEAKSYADAFPFQLLNKLSKSSTGPVLYDQANSDIWIDWYAILRCKHSSFSIGFTQNSNTWKVGAKER